MVLVLFLLGIIIIVSILLFLLLCSTIKIEIQHLEMENILTPKLTYDYQILVGIYLFGKLPLLVIPIDKKKLAKAKIMEKIKKVPVEEDIIWNFDFLKNFKILSPKIENFQLNMKIGTEDAVYTSAIVFIMSMIFSLGLPHLVESKYHSNVKYEITPLYAGKNLFSLQFQSIIYVKMVHIINIIYIYLQKRREERNERTSNRRSYADSYEQYTRYGRCKYHYRGTN